ncbi:MAG: hypothetical protein AB1899_06400 [Pseudomonadota bacterium]
MKFQLASVAVILSAFALSACSQTPATSSEAPKQPAAAAAPAAPTISDEAKQALTQAEADVKSAKSKFALWTTAETALKQAQEAAKAGDSAAVVKQAKKASEQAQFGIAQLSYPSTEQK